jgi:TonB C terminal
VAALVEAGDRKTPAQIVDGPDYLASKNAGQNASAPASPEPRYPVMVAGALGAAPGAIICGDLDTVMAMFDWYAEHQSQTMQNALTNGQSSMLHGAPLQAPPLAQFGCTLAKPGTKLSILNVYGAAFLVEVAPGRRGVTNRLMLHPTPEAAALAEKQKEEAYQAALVSQKRQNEISDYQARFTVALRSNPIVPRGWIAAGMDTQMSVEVAPNGKVYDAKIEASSRFQAMDDACIDLLRSVHQFDVPPDGIGIILKFDCDATWSSPAR